MKWVSDFAPQGMFSAMSIETFDCKDFGQGAGAARYRTGTQLNFLIMRRAVSTRKNSVVKMPVLPWLRKSVLK